MKTLFSMLMIVFIFSAVNIKAQNMDQDQIKAKIQKMDDEFAKAMMKGDYTTIANQYTDDAISMPSFEPMWRGKSAILEGNKKDFQTMKFNSFSNKITDVFVSGDMAVEIGTVQVNITVPNMKNAIDNNGKYVTIWQKQSDGSWKVKADTWNTDVNPMSGNQAGAKPKTDYDK